MCLNMKSIKYISLICLVNYCYSAKILGIFPSCGYSQFILGGKLMRELVARGHEVTVISPFPSKAPLKNYKDVPVTELNEHCKGKNLFDMASTGPVMNIIGVNELGLLLTETTFENQNVKDLLNSNSTFDLVICEIFFNYAQMAFAHHFEAPLIIFSSQGPNEWTKNLLRHPLPFVYVPFGTSQYTYEMKAFQRIRNSLLFLFYDFYDYLFIRSRHDKLLKKYLPGSPTVSELTSSIDLILYNSHVSSNVAVPTLPNMIEIAGFHIDPKPLPEDLKSFLDEARDGVIYFSMGSNLKSADLNSEKRAAFLDTFSKLKQKVLWKWEDDNFDGMPGNVKTRKWLPQQDILAHPNVKLFITHCGLLSTIETIYFGVPILGIPIFGDQKMNCAISKARGIGLSLSFADINEESLGKAINELLSNTKYKDNAKFRASMMHDRDMKPMDKVIYWIDYVLRYKGAQHLQAHGRNMSWCQYYMLDLIAIVVTFSTILVLVCWFLLRRNKKCVGKKSEKVKKH